MTVNILKEIKQADIAEYCCITLLLWDASSFEEGFTKEGNNIIFEDSSSYTIQDA